MLEDTSKEEQKHIEKVVAEAEKVNGEVAEKVGEEAAEEVKKVVVEAIKSEFSGPIPPPNIIKGYEEILPGSADRIIAMAETQMAHRQAMEKKMIEAESRDSLLGVLFAFLLGMGCLGAGIIMVISVPQSAGAISAALLGGTGIGSITSRFISSAKNNSGNSTKTKNKHVKEDNKKDSKEESNKNN